MKRVKQWSKSERTYVAFIDLQRAFPSINRAILDQKMISLRFPNVLRHLIIDIFNRLRMHIVSGDEITTPLQSTVGVPEGNCWSPILFAIFTADIELFLRHRAPIVGGKERRSIFFADDGAIMAVSAEELQRALDDFEVYCKQNNLTIDASKMKTNSKRAFLHQQRRDRSRERI